MYKIWIAKYANGGSEARVYGRDETDAKRSAFSLYTFVNAMSTNRLKIDDVVESVTLAEVQTMGGNAVQPRVEYTEDDPEWERFGLNKIIAGGMEFDVKSRTVKQLKV